MTDIVEWLRTHADSLDWTGAETAAKEREAADEIEKQRRLIKSLERLAHRLADHIAGPVLK